MQQVYNLFAVAVSTSASLGWSLKQLKQRWLSEVWRKIWGICRRRPGHCSVVMDRSVIGAAPVSRKTSRLKHDKTDNVNLKWDPHIICNRWCKIHHQKVLDVKRISHAMAAPTDVISTIHSELNWRKWTSQSKLNFTVETDWTSNRALQ